MLQNAPSLGMPSESLSNYIISIHQSYIESSAVLSIYMLSTGKSGRGITFKNAFQLFYRDFYRLFAVTEEMKILPRDNAERRKIQDWFKRGKGILDVAKTNKQTALDFAEEGLELSKQWVSILYSKQIIQTMRN